MAEVGVLAYPEFLPATPTITTTQPEVVPVVATSPVPLVSEGLAIAKANAG
jgi:hypothetical protein